jgi:hypothetical protein
MVKATRNIFTRLGKAGEYVGPEAIPLPPVPSLFILSLGQEIVGELGQVTGVRDEISIITEDIPSPRIKGKVTIPGPDPELPEVGETTWTLVARLHRDGYYEKWIVREDE